MRMLMAGVLLVWATQVLAADYAAVGVPMEVRQVA